MAKDKHMYTWYMTTSIDFKIPIICSGDDLLLQAAKSQDEPHKIKRTRLGDSEKWRLTSSGYVNSRWNKVMFMKFSYCQAYFNSPRRTLGKKNLTKVSP